jgi:hypothetical protein
MDKRNAYILAGVAAASSLGGGLAGYLLATHKLRRAADREIAEVRRIYRDKTEALERQYLPGEVPVEWKPAVGASVGEQAADIPVVDGYVAVVRGYASADGGEANLTRIVPRGDPQDTGSAPVRFDYSQAATGVDPTLGLNPEDYEDGASESFGFDDSGDEDLLDDEEDGSFDAEGDEDGFALGSGPHSGETAAPFVITEKRFSEECLDYAKLSLRFFKGDKVLADDGNAPVRNVRGTIGENSLSFFGIDPNQPDIVFVRNHGMQTDFEVLRDLGSYAREVLGVGTPNPKPQHIIRRGV